MIVSVLADAVPGASGFPVRCTTLTWICCVQARIRGSFIAPETVFSNGVVERYGDSWHVSGWVSENTTGKAMSVSGISLRT